ncbi:hypothetical protein [Streptomyces cellulosae]|uniref:Uncharacterized protein n=1 Tax=Streptomyces cellulosae TaxID=1968 RepID=A0ABW7YI65_STRCE
MDQVALFQFKGEHGGVLVVKLLFFDEPVHVGVVRRVLLSLLVEPQQEPSQDRIAFDGATAFHPRVRRSDVKDVESVLRGRDDLVGVEIPLTGRHGCSHFCNELSQPRSDVIEDPLQPRYVNPPMQGRDDDVVSKLVLLPHHGKDV